MMPLKPLAAPIHDDAAHYSIELAESRYETPPWVLPTTPSQNILIIGPRGSGKTMMLKALVARWRREEHFLPVYIDLEPTISKIAGEVPRSGDGASLRDQAMASCMALAVSVALSQKVAECAGSECAVEAFQHMGLPLETPVQAAFKKIEETVYSRAPVPFAAPHVTAIAEILGGAVRTRKHRELVFLIDQIDQVADPVFGPIAALLQRHTNCHAVLATRPCPTAPLRSTLGQGAVYRLLRLEHDARADTWAHFLERVAGRLPLPDSLRAGLSTHIAVLAHLTWPSLRPFVSIVRTMIGILAAERSTGVSAACIKAIHEEAHDYEELVENALGAWCADPMEVIRVWRARARTLVPRDQAGPTKSVRAVVTLPPESAAEGDATGKFLRMAIQSGVLFTTSAAPYIFDRLPRKVEIAPLLLGIDDAIGIAPHEISTVEWAMDHAPLKALLKRPFTRRRRDPSVFVARRETGNNDLASILEERISSAVTVRSGLNTPVSIRRGQGHGSRLIPTHILEQLCGTAAVVCDLTVPRRDVYLEYGAAIGASLPVLQAFRSLEKRGELPPWTGARTLWPFASDVQIDALVREIVGLLARQPSPEERWWVAPNADPSDLRVAGNPTRVAAIGSIKCVERIAECCAPQVREEGFDLQRVPLNSGRSQDLPGVIRAARGAGTLIVGLDNSVDDYLAIVSAGIVLSRPRMDDALGRSAFRRVFVSRQSEIELVGQMLHDHPSVSHYASDAALTRGVADRVRDVRAWLTTPKREKKSRG